MKQFIEWDSIDVRVDGAKVAAMARQMTASEPMLEKLELTFANGLLRVDGSIRKFISIPFRVDITRFEASGTTVRVPLARVSAGPIPIPAFLIGLVRDRLPKNVVTFEDPAIFVISLERFLPSFVSADIQKIWIIDGGLAVTLGRGGADIPQGGLDGNETRPDGRRNAG
jgi:hypothetical protein